ncbi:MAG: non-canonical purine NTP pyrophosphatase [Candidatus Nanohaloarchaea archaeon]|nr:non-canonical purine NTP pyrophosphatase [Candidatus Nanohaloarchaea archaeon]
MTLTFVTSNPDKLTEAEDILGIKMERKDIELQEIQAVDIETVARAKVEAARRHIDPPVMVTDTGLYLEGLNGLPGALIKWFYKRIGNEGICDILDGKPREAEASTCIALHDGSDIHTFQGTVQGHIPETPRGDRGFGWDPIFVPEQHESTFAEMEPGTKNVLSMRKEALQKLRDWLDQQKTG